MRPHVLYYTCPKGKGPQSPRDRVSNDNFLRVFSIRGSHKKKSEKLQKLLTSSPFYGILNTSREGKPSKPERIDTMATNKMTTVKALEVALSYVPADMADVVEKLEKMKEQAIKKNTAPRKPSKSQIENDELRVKILDFLIEENAPKRISEICEGIPELEDASSQKISGLLRPLILHGRVEKFIDKRVTFFQMAKGI